MGWVKNKMAVPSKKVAPLGGTVLHAKAFTITNLLE